MLNLERNPELVRQGAAAFMCVAVAAVAMPAVAWRAAEQREGPGLGALGLAGVEAEAQFAEISLASDRMGDFAYGAHGASVLGHDALDGAALFLRAALTTEAPRLEVSAAVVERPRLRSGALRLNTASHDVREKRCLAEAIYYEARGESFRGQVAVAEVVMNRSRSGYYPRTLCGVVYQGAERGARLGCQFSFTCDGSLRHRPHGRMWAQANDIAEESLAGAFEPLTNRATHYHTVAIRPRWAGGLVETTRVGAHVFYRLPSSLERRALQAARQTWPEDAGRPTAPSPAEEGVVATDGLEAASPPPTADPAAPPANPADAPLEAVLPPAPEAGEPPPPPLIENEA